MYERLDLDFAPHFWDHVQYTSAPPTSISISSVKTQTSDLKMKRDYENDKERPSEAEAKIETELKQEQGRVIISKPKLKKTKATEPSSQIKASSWSLESSACLKKIIEDMIGGDQNKKSSWKTIYEEFKTSMPDVEKTSSACRMHWRQVLKNSSSVDELTSDELELFKKAVAEVDGVERSTAYAWRFEVLSGKKLNKSSAAKIHKSLSDA